MKRIIWAMVGIGVCLLAFRFGPVIPAYAQDADWQKVDETLGRKPAVSDDVRRYGFPRTDLSVTLDGVRSSRRWRWVAGSRSSRRMAVPWSWATSCCSRPRSIP